MMIEPEKRLLSLQARRIIDEVFGLRDMWVSIRNRIKRLNDEGSALLTVVLVVTFLTVLATILMYISGLNFQIKQQDYQNKKNFYTGEEALEEIKASLMLDVSNAALLANEDLAADYASIGSEDLRMSEYNTYFVQHLQELWDAKLATYGSWENLMRSYLHYADPADYELRVDYDTYDTNHDGVLSSSEVLTVNEMNGSVIVKGFGIKYTNPDNRLTTMIMTDFRVTAPAIDWSANASRTEWKSGVDTAAALEEGMELVTPTDSVIYTNWVKE